jgi:hypothetical protein
VQHLAQLDDIAGRPHASVRGGLRVGDGRRRLLMALLMLLGLDGGLELVGQLL